jgi:hypothetical protein
MSVQITEAFVKQYSANVFHLSQQKGSKLRSLVRQESQNSKASFFDRIGAVVAQKKTSRHADTPRMDTPHSRRRVTLSDYEYADLVDNEDKIKMLISPESEYAVAAMWAMGRAMDDEIIAAALGTAYAGEEGSTAVSLPSTQKVAAFDGTTTTGVNLNVKTLRKVKEKFDANDVDESIPRHFAIGSSQLQSLLGQTEVTSSDYASIKALVMGQVNTFMGFNFVRTERLPRSAANVTYTVTNGVTGAGTGTITAANSRRCIAWAQDGVILSIGQDIKGRLSERDDKSYAMQVYACMGIGSARIEEEKVVEVICSE